MNSKELNELIYKEVCKATGCNGIEEKSVPEPYDRYSAREMTPSQVKRRDGIGKSMMNDKNATKYFKKNYGKDWESWLWAVATNIAMQKE